MPLSAASSIIIDLVLLADATADADRDEIRRLAKRVAGTASAGGSSSIAEGAASVARLASNDPLPSSLAATVHRLLVAAEQELHALPLHGAAWAQPIQWNALVFAPDASRPR